MVLVRYHLGDVLRRRRVAQGRTLRQVSAEARVSLGYLSEIERGQKEASSELLASVCEALDVPLSDVFHQVGDELAGLERTIRPVRSVDSEYVGSDGAEPARIEARAEPVASAA